MSDRRPPVLLDRHSERQQLDRLLGNVRGGQSAMLVIRGEAGVGKTTLLRYCSRQASGFRVLRISGIESEMELPFAGLHQLCAPLLGRLEALPEPQRAALEVALGLASGGPPDRFLVGLAALSLLAEVAAERPLLYLIDDAQWLDGASAQVVGFVARRLLAESVGIVFGVREPADARELAGLPELWVEGLPEEDARALLATVIPGRIDAAVRDRLVAETRGNPLALVELPRELTATQLPGAFGLQETHELSGRIEESFLRRLEALPEPARRLLLVAAAEPVDDPLLIWRAAERLGIGPWAAGEVDEWLTVGDRVTFRHPLVRSAVYRAASLRERQAVHLALAHATGEADRRAWHLAAAAPGPDEAVAAELERSAGRAQARGGLGAAAAFLERAVMLSPDPEVRATRLLAAARAKRDAGALDDALRLLRTVDAEAFDELGRAGAEALRGQIAFDQLHVTDAVRHLTEAALALETVDVSLARRTHLEALGAAMYDSADTRAVAEAALRAPAPPGEPGVGDALLDASAVCVTRGHVAAAEPLRRAVELVLAPAVTTEDRGHWLWYAVAGNALTLPQELWDADTWRTAALRYEELARDTGALVQLQFSLHMVAWVHVLGGEPERAALVIEEEALIAEATGNRPLGFMDMLVGAWRGEATRAGDLIDATLRVVPAAGRVGSFAFYARALLLNGLGRHEEARDAALEAFAADHIGFGCVIVPELAEAAAKAGDGALLARVLAWMSERTSVTRTEWSLGTEALVRALAGEGDAAYVEAIERLGRTWLRPQRARAQLLYGEWLRACDRRDEAREQLRGAYGQLAAMGAQAFAERARRELAASGERVRKRAAEASDELTPQERQIAHLAREGLSNPDIGARLFLSPRTVEWHLKKVFTKLGISSRRALRDALPSPDEEASPA